MFTLIYNTAVLHENQKIQEIHDTRAKAMRLLPYHAWETYGYENWDDATSRLDEGDYLCEDGEIRFVKRLRTRTYLEVARGY